MQSGKYDLVMLFVSYDYNAWMLIKLNSDSLKGYLGSMIFLNVFFCLKRAALKKPEQHDQGCY